MEGFSEEAAFELRCVATVRYLAGGERHREKRGHLGGEGQQKIRHQESDSVAGAQLHKTPSSAESRFKFRCDPRYITESGKAVTVHMGHDQICDLVGCTTKPVHELI